MKTEIRNYICERFAEQFSRKHTDLFRAPGRIEIIGNHTDHQRGCIAAAAVDLEIAAAAARNEDSVIRVFSEGFPVDVIDLRQLEPQKGEENRSAALIRGIAARFVQLGYAIGGFDAYSVSEVPKGSGLSSSAAFEVLIGTILNHLYNDGAVSPVEVAQIGQYAENVYFGKPCGLMDQLASSVGGCIFVDFGDKDKPEITPLAFTPEKYGYSICIVNSGAAHDGLTADYASIPADMGQISRLLHREVLSEASEAELYQNYAMLHWEADDRAFLRAAHFFGENARVLAFRDAAENGDFECCLSLIRESGASSASLLQSVIPTGAVSDQTYAAAITLCKYYAGERGIVRPHGGGFAGTVLALIPQERVASFAAAVNEALGADSCTVVQISPRGGCRIEEE